MTTTRIRTRFVPRTTEHGSRCEATSEAGSTALAWDYSESDEQNHVACARFLAERELLSGSWFGVGSHETGWTFVLVGPDVMEGAAFVV